MLDKIKSLILILEIEISKKIITHYTRCIRNYYFFFIIKIKKNYLNYNYNNITSLI